MKQNLDNQKFKLKIVRFFFGKIFNFRTVIVWKIGAFTSIFSLEDFIQFKYFQPVNFFSLCLKHISQFMGNIETQINNVYIKYICYVDIHCYKNTLNFFICVSLLQRKQLRKSAYYTLSNTVLISFKIYFKKKNKTSC